MIERVPIEDLVLLERNPRKITEAQFKKLVKSLKDDPSFFEARPCLVNRIDDLLIVYGGNQRVRAAKKLGWNLIPCIIDDDLDQKVVNSRIIKDNNHYGQWDYDILSSDYEMEDLLKAGFPENFLDIGLGEEDPPKKQKKLKLCDKCQAEI